MTFEKWWIDKYGPPTCLIDDCAKSAASAAWQAATLAERERCETRVLDNCFKDCNCPECENLRAIAAAIRKGEGV